MDLSDLMGGDLAKEKESYFRFPESFISLLESVCLVESGKPTRHRFFRDIAPVISRLSDRFNRIGALPEALDGPKGPFYGKGEHLAYLAYFLPANFFKMSYLLLECLEGIKGENPLPRKIEVLDLGAGPGTAGLGLLDFAARYPVPYFQNREISIRSVDREREFLRYSETLFCRYRDILAKPLAERSVELRFKTDQRKMPGNFPEDGSRYHFIFAGNLLNELNLNRSVKSLEKIGDWMAELLGLLEPGGRLILFEPALRDTSRDLLFLRNRLAETGRAAILFPCLHQGPCPILAPGGSEKDWCHQEKPWDPPEWISELDALTGKRKDSLKYSGLILCRSGPFVHCAPDEWRVVSEMIVTKGKKELILCNESGRKRFYLLDKEEADQNSEFSSLRRGDKVIITGGEGNGKNRIGPGWKIQKAL